MTISLESFRRGLVAVAIATCVGPVGSALAEDVTIPSASPPVVVTSLGQSLDAFQVQLVVQRAGAEVIYEQLADIDILEGGQSLILAVGASLKGFGEAGISIAQERERARRFISAAEERGMPIIVVHIGGAERRDDLSNQLIEVSAPHADVIFIRADSDGDGLFTRIAEENDIPLVSVATIVELLPKLREMLGTGS